jgi:ParB family chromosome partitioning protein
VSQVRSAAKDLVEAAKGKASRKAIDRSPSSSFSKRLAAADDVATGRRSTVLRLEIDPDECTMWRRHNRLYDRLNAENCGDLIERIGSEGQQVPAIVRRTPKGSSHQFEVIAGARRHFAVSYLRNELGRSDIFYIVEVRVLDDVQAFALSDLENRTRKDISDYERGLDYSSALSEFYEGNVSRMSEAIGMPRGSLRNYINLARLPEVVLDAYGDVHALSVRHGNGLNPLFSNDSVKGQVLAAAQEIADIQKAARETSGELALDGASTYKRLMEAAQKPITEPSPTYQKKAEVSEISDGEGKPLLSAQRGRKYMNLKVPIDQLGNKKAIIEAIKKVL